MPLINVQSEMTGNVWKVLVSEGEEVSEGDELLILESMKMEIPIVAPADGVITKINVKEGEYLPEGKVTLVIEN